MNTDTENNDLIEDDTPFVELDSNIEDQDDTADLEISEIINPKDLLNRKIATIIEDFGIGKTEDFKNMMIGLFNLIVDNSSRIYELESQLEEIKNQFYRNELSDNDFKELLLLDEEE